MSRKRSESVSGVFPEFFWNFFRKVPAVLGVWPIFCLMSVILPPAIPSAVNISGLQKGPAERGHVKKRQKSSKSIKELFDTFRQFSRRAKNVKNRQKASKSFSTLFDNFRAAPFFRPLLGGSANKRGRQEKAKMVSVPSIGVMGKSALKIGHFLRRNFWGPLSLPAPLVYC